MLIMAPHSGSGGCTPRPRKERLAAERMTAPAVRVGLDDEGREGVAQDVVEQDSGGGWRRWLGRLR